MISIGIDLGTTNSLISVYKDGETKLIPNEFGHVLTPSVVHIDETGEIFVGEVAKEKLISKPRHTVASFKSLMGTYKDISIGNRTFKPHELSSFVIKKLIEDAISYLGTNIDEAIISVPAYFNDNQRSATKLAAKLAGINVTQLINEPSAAALSYLKDIDEAKLLVIDFGGGTLDVSIVDCYEKIIEIIAIAGDNKLGGDDIDHAIAKYFFTKTGRDIKDKSDIYKQARLVKEGKKQFIYDGEESIYFDKEILLGICESIFDRCKNVIANAFENANINPNKITDVILVGGSSNFGLYREFLHKLFGRSPVLVKNPDEIVAHGAGLYSAINNRDISDIIMTDVCPFSLGTGVVNEKCTDNLRMSFIINRSSILPISKTETYVTTYDGQEEILFGIYQGENYYAKQNLKLGEISIKVPKAKRGEAYIDVTFSYNINGILDIEIVTCENRVYKKVILNKQLNISDKSVQEQINSLQLLKVCKKVSEEKLLLSKLEAIFAKSNVRNREKIDKLYKALEEAIYNNRIIETKKIVEYIEEELCKNETINLEDIFDIL